MPISGFNLGPGGIFANADIIDPTFPTIASASTISPVDQITLITGNTTINTITQPHPYFMGPLYLLNNDASPGALGTSGNIAIGTQFTQYQPIALFYNTTTSKWYPMQPQTAIQNLQFGVPSNFTAPATIASAATIAPTTAVSVITGTAQVATITPPVTGAHSLVLIYTNATPGATLTSGNIALATTVVSKKALTMTYEPGAAKYYPSY